MVVREGIERGEQCSTAPRCELLNGAVFILVLFFLASNKLGMMRAATPGRTLGDSGVSPPLGREPAKFLMDNYHVTKTDLLVRFPKRADVIPASDVQE